MYSAWEYGMQTSEVVNNYGRDQSMFTGKGRSGLCRAFVFLALALVLACVWLQLAPYWWQALHHARATTWIVCLVVAGAVSIGSIAVACGWSAWLDWIHWHRQQMRVPRIRVSASICRGQTSRYRPRSASTGNPACWLHKASRVDFGVVCRSGASLEILPSFTVGSPVRHGGRVRTPSQFTGPLATMG